MNTKIHKKTHLPWFILITFILSWLIWVPQAAAKLGIINVSFNSSLTILGFISPALSAIIVVTFSKNQNLGTLFHSFTYWRNNIGWYLFSLHFAVILLISQGIDTLIGLSYKFVPLIVTMTNTENVSIVQLLPFAVIIALLTTFGEELGWRGFVLPRLLNKYNALISSIILAVIYGLWHIPLFIALGQSSVQLVVQLITALAFVIIMTWVFINTNGSLLMVWFIHCVTTVSHQFLGPIPSITDDIFVWIVAVAILVFTGPKNFSRNKQWIMNKKIFRSEKNVV